MQHQFTDLLSRLATGDVGLIKAAAQCGTTAPAILSWLEKQPPSAAAALAHAFADGLEARGRAIQERLQQRIAEGLVRDKRLAEIEAEPARQLLNEARRYRREAGKTLAKRTQAKTGTDSWVTRHIVGPIKAE